MPSVHTQSDEHGRYNDLTPHYSVQNWSIVCRLSHGGRSWAESLQEGKGDSRTELGQREETEPSAVNTDILIVFDQIVEMLVAFIDDRRLLVV